MINKNIKKHANTSARFILIAIGITLSVSAAFFSTRAEAVPPQFSITKDFGLSISAGYGFSINDLGMVAGTREATNYPTNVLEAFRWNGVTLEVLSGLGGRYSRAYGINNLGQVVGVSETADGNRHAVVWNGTVPTDLGLGVAQDINDAGQIVGELNGGGVRWTGNVPESLGGSAWSINQAGQVAGDIGGAPTRWTGTIPETLAPSGFFTYAGGINSSGQVIGTAPINGSVHPFIWTGTTTTDLGSLTDPDLAIPHSINDSGWVIGEDTGVGTMFLYANGGMYDLRTLVPTFGLQGFTPGPTGGLNKMNNLGQIVIEARFIGENFNRLIILTPTPEPTSAALLLGCGALLVLRRRRSPAGA